MISDDSRADEPINIELEISYFQQWVTLSVGGLGITVSFSYLNAEK